jgi:hypothetical protein
MTARAASALVLVALLWSYRNARGDVGWGGFADDPAAFDGVERVASLFRVVEVGPRGAVLQKGGVRLPVRPAGSLAVGDEATVSGRWDQAAGVFQADWIEVAEGRDAKRWLSTAALVALGVLAALTLRRDPDGWRVLG